MGIVHEDRGNFSLMGMFFVDFYDLAYNILYFSGFNSTATLFIDVGHGPVARYSKPCMNGMTICKGFILTSLKRNRHNTSYDSFNRTSLRDVSQKTGGYTEMSFILADQWRPRV
jgi:hypothetical protein